MTLAKLFKKNERKPVTFPLTGKYLIINPSHFKEEYRKRKLLVMQATGGFGCLEHTNGSAVSVRIVGDGEEVRFNREDFVAEFVGDIEALKQEA